MPSLRSKPVSPKVASAPSASDPVLSPASVAATLETLRRRAGLSDRAPERASESGPVLVAVSGGADSMALAHLLAAAGVPQLHAATVDHGLRAEASAEARQVAHWCAGLGVPHTTLRWEGARPRRGVQDAARTARYRLLSSHARMLGPGSVIATAHHQDDQAETVWMRLQRGAGTAGLAGIRPVCRLSGSVVVRPLLDVPRAALRAWLTEIGQPWLEDPSNADQAFTRVRVRAQLAALPDAAALSHALAGMATRMAAADDALAALADDLVRCARSERDVLHVAKDSVLAMHDRYGPVPVRRALAHWLQAQGGAGLPPRSADLDRLLALILVDGLMKPRTLAHCRIWTDDAVLHIGRER